jgi:polyhydroxyalkanoate synthesis repressor PhaR
MPIIKRYANRKLYDTSARRYVTLGGIAALIAQGETVHIIENETGEDITTQTLAQVILEQEKLNGGIFPQVALAHLIQTGASAVHNIYDGLSGLLNPMELVEFEIERRVKSLIEKELLSEEEGNRLSAMLSGEKITPDEPPASDDEPIDVQKVADLQAEVERLENELAALQNRE